MSFSDFSDEAFALNRIADALHRQADEAETANATAKQVAAILRVTMEQTQKVIALQEAQANGSA